MANDRLDIQVVGDDPESAHRYYRTNRPLEWGVEAGVRYEPDGDAIASVYRGRWQCVVKGLDVAKCTGGGIIAMLAQRKIFPVALPAIFAHLEGWFAIASLLRVPDTGRQPNKSITRNQQTAVTCTIAMTVALVDSEQQQ